MLLQDFSCSSSGAFVVSYEAIELGRFKRQFTSTLCLCRVTELAVGFYQCVINRTRGDNVNITEVWSASVRLSPISKYEGINYELLHV